MHRLSASFILGYHGCSVETAEYLLSGNAFEPSKNTYDWLGSGIYFWESNPVRAKSYACEKRLRDRASWGAAVVGAVVDLGFCLDLTTESGVEQVRDAYRSLLALHQKANEPMPVNSGGPNKLVRNLDCAVITNLHRIRQENRETSFDSVRGVFLEGAELYPTAGFHEKTHVQICVCNPAMIKGVFRVAGQGLGF